MLPGAAREVPRNVPESDQDEGGTEPGRWLAIEAGYRELAAASAELTALLEARAARKG